MKNIETIKAFKVLDVDYAQGYHIGKMNFSCVIHLSNYRDSTLRLITMVTHPLV